MGGPNPHRMNDEQRGTLRRLVPPCSAAVDSLPQAAAPPSVHVLATDLWASTLTTAAESQRRVAGTTPASASAKPKAASLPAK
jgi:hypothetical protein